MKKACQHKETILINPYEIIRKYICVECKQVIMCSCDEIIGIRFLPYQLTFGTDLKTQTRIQVTGGFQESICDECRGLPVKAYPKAELRGATSKIKRYYWRELMKEGYTLFGAWAFKQGFDNWSKAHQQYPEIFEKYSKEALANIKTLHQNNPKYIYSERSAEDIVNSYKIEIMKLESTYVKQKGKKSKLLWNDIQVGPEEFVSVHFKSEGYNVLFTESIPFHVLFGIFFWTIIQAPDDPLGEIRGFSDRNFSGETNEGAVIYTPFPQDFGTEGYFRRMRQEIENHLVSLGRTKPQLLSIFDNSLNGSHNLRQYLWAHEEKHIEIARTILEILPTKDFIKILEYLIGDYWHRYLGWPDLLVYNETEFFFIDVKSSKDKLSENQKKWIENNSNILHLPFKIVKIHKTNEIKL